MIEGHVRLFGMGINSYDTMSALMLYSLDLPLFFFISGYLANKPNMSAKETVNSIIKKFKYLVLPAIAFKPDKASKPQRKRNKYIMIVLLLISLAFVGLLSTTGSVGPRVFDTNHLFKYFYFFFFGMLANKYSYIYNRMVYNEYVKASCIIGFFTLLLLLDYQIWPSSVLHLLRDIVLRVLGTFMIVILFASHSAVFEKSSKLVRVLVDIGKRSLPIYLLQYFFMPDFKMFPALLSGADQFTIHVIAAVYTLLITLTCYAFIKVMEQSKFVRTYVLRLK